MRSFKLPVAWCEWLGPLSPGSLVVLPGCLAFRVSLGRPLFETSLPSPSSCGSSRRPHQPQQAPQLLSSDRVGVRVQRPRSEVGRTARTARRPVDDDSNCQFRPGRGRRRSFVVFGDSNWATAEHEAEPGRYVSRWQFLPLRAWSLVRRVTRRMDSFKAVVKAAKHTRTACRNRESMGKPGCHHRRNIVFEIGGKSVGLITVGQISPDSVTVIGPLVGRHRPPLLPQHLPPHHQQKIAWPLVADAVSAF